MKVFIKKVSCIMLSMFILVFSAVMPLNAAGLGNDYITFANPNSRMDENGNFVFDVGTSVTSDKFIADSNKLTVVTQAMVENQSIMGNGPYIDEDVSFRVTLYKKGLIGGTMVGYYDGYADNIRGGVQFSVKEGKTYYFTIDVLTYIPVQYSIVGSGQVYPITLVD